MSPVFDPFKLARSNPGKLLTLVRTRDLPPMLLSAAVEALGTVVDTRAVQVLFELLEDADDLVREGAVHGLSNYLEVHSVRGWLEKVAASDPCPTVREAARGWL